MDYNHGGAQIGSMDSIDSLRNPLDGKISIVINCGRWIRYVNGEWDFKIDKSRLGRSVDCSNGETLANLVQNVRQEYNLPSDVHVELTYWVNGDMEPKPWLISSDADLHLFLTRQQFDLSVNMFSSFRDIVNDQMQFVQPAASAEGPSQKLADVVVNENRVDVTFDEQDDELFIAAADAVFASYSNQTTNEVTRAGMLTNLYNVPITSASGDHLAEDDNSNDGSDGYISPDDYDYDFWEELINEENIDPQDKDDDDFVEVPPNNRSGQSRDLALCTREVTPDDIYGFDDVEPMFSSLSLTPFDASKTDLSNENDYIYKGQVFDSKEEFKLRMAIHAIKRMFRFKITRHAKNNTTMSCVDKKCDWRVYATAIDGTDKYEVKVYLQHTCTIEARSQFNKHATSKVVAALLCSKYGTVTSGPRARDLPEMVLVEYNIDASYWKCWKARELAIASAIGNLKIT